MGKAEIAALESLLSGGTGKRKSKKTSNRQRAPDRKFTSVEPPEIAQQTRILGVARAADNARDRSNRPSVKQIGSRATLDILKKQEDRAKKRAQQKKDRKFTKVIRNLRSTYMSEPQKTTVEGTPRKFKATMPITAGITTAGAHPNFAGNYGDGTLPPCDLRAGHLAEPCGWQGWAVGGRSSQPASYYDRSVRTRLAAGVCLRFPKRP
jgi:hypothetical protein